MPWFRCVMRPCLMFLLGLAAMGTRAQADFPNRPIETIVPYAAGGGVAAMARAFATEAGHEMGQPWVVVNREGGGGVVGFGALARAKADGYTVVFSPASPLTNAPFINSSMPFRNEQIEPVCQIFENVFAIAVKPDSPVKSVRDLIDRARAKPGGVSYGHAGPASVGHMSIAAIEAGAKVKFNPLPYRGDNPALTDLLGGSLDFAALGVGTLAGKDVRVLAVLSDKRHPALPDVPSITELGHAGVSQGLNGLYVPAGTPRAIVARFEDVCRKVTASPAFLASAKTLAQVPAYLNAADFKARIAATTKAHEALVPGLHLERN